MNSSGPPPISKTFSQFCSAIERYWPWLLAAVTILFVAFNILLDIKRPIWNDELFTYYISRQRTLLDVWNVLKTGAEQLPPFFFVVIRSFTAVLGSSVLAFRLPETLGFLVMNLSLFFFVRKRSSALYGLVAFLFPAVTDAYYFANEARPYGLVMAFSGLAMLFWQAAAEKTKRSPALIGLASCLALALSCHYYAVLVFVPFGIAELVRLRSRKQLDLPMYAAILAGLFPLLLFLPLLRAASGYSSKFWSKPHWSMAVSFYEDLLAPAAFALLLLLLLGGIYVWRERARDLRGSDLAGCSSNEFGGSEAMGNLPLAHEAALVFGFALLPFIAICLAELVTGAFTSRYAVYSVMGLSVLLAWSLSFIARRGAALAFMAIVALLGCWSVLSVRHYQRSSYNAADAVDTLKFLQAQPPNIPIVIASPHLFFVLSHFASLTRGRDLVYLADVNQAINYTNTDTVERGLLALRRYAPLHVEDYQQFTASHPEFLLYGQTYPFQWIFDELLRVGRPMSVTAHNGSNLLYLVSSGNLSNGSPSASK